MANKFRKIPKNDGNVQKRKKWWESPKMKNIGIFWKFNKCWKFQKIKYIGGISGIGVDSGNWLNADNWLISGTGVDYGTQ